MGAFWDLSQGHLLLLNTAWMEAGPGAHTPRLPREIGHLSLHYQFLGEMRPKMSFCQGIGVEGLGDRKVWVWWGGVTASV